jgi:hypothetical protein
MTADEAISALEMCQSLMLFNPMTGETHELWEENRDNQDLYNACSIAISALRRAQPENKPLTQDEMNALDREPIYVLHTGGKWTMNGWHIATAASYRNHGRCDLEIDNGNTTIDMQNYGNTWLAYRRNPERSENE